MRLPLLVLLAALAGPAAADGLTVSAASSLSNAFKEIAAGYEQAYPGAHIALNFGASGALLQQIAKGAPADVFASADQQSMDDAEKQKLIVPNGRRDFARNTLVVITPLDTAHPVLGIGDLAQPNIKRIAISTPASVPVGRYAKRALDLAKLWSAIQPKAVHTQNVRQSLDYVARGEVDAGFVYATDAAIMRDKVKLAFPVALDQSITYPIAPVSASAHADEAKRFVGYVMSPAGQAILARFGFTHP